MLTVITLRRLGGGPGLTNCMLFEIKQSAIGASGYPDI